MSNSNFTVHRPKASAAVPLIIHVPHAADVIPTHCRGDFVLDENALAVEIATMIDHYTDRLALAAVPLGAFVFQNNVCRLVMDPERYPDDKDEVAAAWGMGAVYTNGSDGQRLRRPDWSGADRDARMHEFYHPYHLAMRELVLELLDRFASPVYILDLHSFPNRPFPYETDAGLRPLFCLGYTEQHVPTVWLDWWRCREREHQVACSVNQHSVLVDYNRPFSGSFVPSALPSGGQRVRSLMIEINRILLPQHPHRDFDPKQRKQLRIFDEFVEFACAGLRNGRI